MRRYTLAARVRPLFFWIGKDNVGEARLTWLEREDGSLGYGLLIGSDPARAPRRINRWGYVSEVEERGEVRVLGLMTAADEKGQSFDQAKGAAARAADGSQFYKVIRATVGGDTAVAAIRGVALPSRLTLHDLDAVIAQLPVPAEPQSVAIPPGTSPGFLFSLASLLRENVDAVHRTGMPLSGVGRSFVYGQKMYCVTARSSRLLKQATVKGRQFANLIDSEFEARAASSPRGERFRIQYGTDGELREVPVRIVYRPNWWFEAEMVLAN